MLLWTRQEALYNRSLFLFSNPLMDIKAITSAAAFRLRHGEKYCAKYDPSTDRWIPHYVEAKGIII